MAFGPDDVGHWKDKLPYVRHDVETIEAREKIFRQFGRFDLGFDFGGPTATARGSGYRNDSSVLGNTVEPRFQAVDPGTRYTDKRGYGWVSDGPREAHEMPLTPYAEIRAVAKNPRHLPQNVLYGDWIRGEGPQVFRVRTGEGRFTVYFLNPEGTSSSREMQANNDVLDIRFPAGEWTISGLVIKGSNTEKPVDQRPEPKPGARPAVTHVPPKTAVAGQPLKLSLWVPAAAGVKSIRLYYRPLNQLEKFKMIEAPVARLPFTIPASDVPSGWNLMYYFELVTSRGVAWFYPDLRTATPYYVVTVEKP
jgi:hypothetical protein